MCSLQGSSGIYGREPVRAGPGAAPAGGAAATDHRRSGTLNILDADARIHTSAAGSPTTAEPAGLPGGRRRTRPGPGLPPTLHLDGAGFGLDPVEAPRHGVVPELHPATVASHVVGPRTSGDPARERAGTGGACCSGGPARSATPPGNRGRRSGPWPMWSRRCQRPGAGAGRSRRWISGSCGNAAGSPPTGGAPRGGWA